MKIINILDNAFRKTGYKKQDNVSEFTVEVSGRRYTILELNGELHIESSGALSITPESKTLIKVEVK